LTQQIKLYNEAMATAISETEGHDISDKKNWNTTLKELRFMLAFLPKGQSLTNETEDLKKEHHSLLILLQTVMFGNHYSLSSSHKNCKKDLPKSVCLKAQTSKWQSYSKRRGNCTVDLYTHTVLWPFTDQYKELTENS
jgi:hypothetical protein